MTANIINDQIRQANDLLAAVSMQRNSIADQAAALGAENLALERRCKAAEAKIASLESQVSILMSQLAKISDDSQNDDSSATETRQASH